MNIIIKREYDLFKAHNYHNEGIQRLREKNKLSLLRKIIKGGRIK